MTTYHKSYTRDNGLILQESWGLGFIYIDEHIFEKENPFRPININYVTDGMVQIWDSQKAFSWFFDELLDVNKKTLHFFEKARRLTESC